MYDFRQITHCGITCGLVPMKGERSRLHSIDNLLFTSIRITGSIEKKNKS